MPLPHHIIFHESALLIYNVEEFQIRGIYSYASEKIFWQSVFKRDLY